MTINKSYCMSSFLMFRMIARDNMSFSKECLPRLSDLAFKRTPVRNPADLKDALKEAVRNATQDGKAALALSGGIDSAILARLMPAGSTAYTFKCVVPGVDVIDETDKARKYADACGLVHKVVEIYWEDVKELAGQLMIHKGAPIHSIEIQIYKAALQAKADGFDKLIFGENADIIYGGMDGLISKDWLYGEFVDRYDLVRPARNDAQPPAPVGELLLPNRSKRTRTYPRPIPAPAGSDAGGQGQRRQTHLRLQHPRR